MSKERGRQKWLTAESYTFRSYQECDAVISNGCEEFQPFAVKALRSYLEDELLKPFYVVSPILSPESSAVVVDDSEEEPFKQVEAFLIRARAQHGAKSVIYVSCPSATRPWLIVYPTSVKIAFGSLFWPSKPEYIEEIFGALIERGIPFVRLCLYMRWVDIC